MAGQLGMSAVLFLGIIPAERMPWLLRGVRAVVPSTYGADALAEALRPHPSTPALLGDLTVCAVVAAVTLALASLAFRRAVRR
jgi:ABC-2 type transport system permease protein